MKRNLLIVGLILVTLTGCGRYVHKSTTNSQTHNANGFKSVYDSVSYAIGIDFGHHIYEIHKEFDSSLEVNMILEGINDVFNDRGVFSPEDGSKIITDFFNIYMPTKYLREAEEYLSFVKNNNSNLIETQSGLLYEIIDMGDEQMRAKRDTDKVTVNFTGYFKDGTEFDKSNDVTFQLNQVIKGWTEGIKLIGKGGRINLIIPPDLAYGSKGAPNTIKPNAVLLFDIELLDVAPYIEEVSDYL